MYHSLKERLTISITLMLKVQEWRNDECIEGPMTVRHSDSLKDNWTSAATCARRVQQIRSDQNSECWLIMDLLQPVPDI